MTNFVKLEDFGKAFVPHFVRPNIKNYFMKAGYREVPYSLFGWLFMLSVVLTGIIFAFIVFPGLSGLPLFLFLLFVFIFWVMIQLSILIVTIVLIYIYVDYRIYERTKEMEDVLEEFLRYVSENLKGGMTFDKALWEAIRPQYGTLAEEIRFVAKKVVTGQDIGEALMEFTDKYNSPTLKRSFQLIIEGMKGGGHIAYIIDKVEKNIRETKELKKEMASANATYVIFMSAIVLVIAPALFGLSYNLLLVMEKIGGTLALSMQNAPNTGIGAFGNISNVAINPSMFKTFSIWAVAVISFFASLILAAIQKGSVKEGIKYIPIFVLVAILMYLFFQSSLEFMFSGMLNI